MQMPYAESMAHPFLLITTRTEAAALSQEVDSFSRIGGLAPAELEHLRLDEEPTASIDIDDYAGILLAGSPYNFLTDQKAAQQLDVETTLHRLAVQTVDADHPFLGVCYGTGTLSNALGGKIDNGAPEPTGPVNLTLTAAAAADPLVAGLPERFSSFVGHQESCIVAPPEATLLITGQRCHVQMFRVKTNVYATQFHPELEWQSLARRLEFYHGHGYYTEAELPGIQDSIRGLETPAANRILTRFVEQYRER